jgi:mono/diheme cytochrome c family protein
MGAVEPNTNLTGRDEMKRLAMITTILMAATGLAAQAQESAGQKEFMIACAVCHGESGMGNGPFTSLMNVPVPNLTTLSAQNEGNFPFLKVFMTVDGRAMGAGHGGPMPVWGDRFTANAGDQYGPYGTELVTRGRILALVNYLETIQQ